MARIRTVKPSFFRHEELIDLEIHHCELKPMLVFQALWGQADRNGVFEWKPRQLQLDILPFYWQETGRKLVDTLTLLVERKFIVILTDGAKVYGYVPTFKDHQRLTGKEAKEPATNPEPHEMQEYCVEDDRGSNGEATGKHSGSNGENRKGMEKGNGVGEWSEQKNPPPTKTELAFLNTFAAKEDDLKRLFPNLNYEVEKETCLAHYRTRERPIDPYVVIVKWFRRAQPDKPPPTSGTPLTREQEIAELRAKGIEI